MIKELYIFVEGETDELFVKNVFNNILLKLCIKYTIVKYACKEIKYIKNYIKTIKKVPQWDYVFIADQDGKNNKKEKIISKYSNLEKDKVFISVYEIESWVISGLSDNIMKKYKLNFSYTDTSNITKEMFYNIVPPKMSALEFIVCILNDYNLENAVNVNNSLKIFNQYLTNKKAS